MFWTDTGKLHGNWGTFLIRAPKAKTIGVLKKWDTVEFWFIFHQAYATFMALKGFNQLTIRFISAHL